MNLEKGPLMIHSTQLEMLGVRGGSSTVVADLLTKIAFDTSLAKEAYSYIMV